MLTQLATIKARLAITVTDYDTLLTNVIKAVSARFDNECNRTFARLENAAYEFDARETEILPLCYPIEAVARFAVTREGTPTARVRA